MAFLNPKVFISVLTASDPYIIKLYSRGSCYQLSLLLQQLFPGGSIHIRNDKRHTAYLYQEVLYDVHGEITAEEALRNYRLITYKEQKTCLKWSSEKNILFFDKKEYTALIKDWIMLYRTKIFMSILAIFLLIVTNIILVFYLHETYRWGIHFVSVFLLIGCVDWLINSHKKQKHLRFYLKK